MKNLKQQFSEPQRVAIEHHTGPCLVLAGPGSGKTLVITHRTKNLIEKYHVKPSNILVITFTKAAAKEMQERFRKLRGTNNDPVAFGTFHAIFFRILMYAYHLKIENILREEEKYKIITELVEDEDLNIEDEKDFVKSIISEISTVKGDMIDLNNYYSSNCSNDVFRSIYTKYHKILERKNLLDFDDMLVKCYELFVQRPDILKIWQEQFLYILIDEFQDINRVQYEIIKMLAAPENNLFIVGDDDQSIYRFRGARPEIMLGFEHDFENVKKVTLSENYRCSGKIIDAAKNLISHNQKRFEKDTKAVREWGCDIDFSIFKTQADESKHIVSDVRRYIEKGLEYRDIAILFRTNTGQRTVIEKLMEYNLPFHMKDSMPNIFEHFIARDIISYIHYAVGEGQRADLLRIINKPNRYIKREFLRSDKVTIDQLKGEFTDKRWMIERLDKLQFDLKLIRQLSPFGAISYIFQGIGYDDYIDDYADYRKIKPQELYDIRDEILESAKPYKTFEEWFDYIEKYGEELKRQTQVSKRLENAIELSTMHSSKGLEYKVVYIVDAIESVTPHAKAVLDDDIEEERRLFYVAVTRAKDELHIFWPKERFGKQVEVSRFVSELNMDKQSHASEV